MKKFHILSILLGSGLLVYLFYRIGLGPLWHQLQLLGWWLLPLIAVQAVAEILHVLGWRCCLARSHQRFSFWRLYQIHMSGFALNYLTPTAQVGGEVTKGALLSSQGSGTEAASGVIIGKLADALAFLIFVSTGSLVTLVHARLPRGLFGALAVGSGLLAAAICTFLLLQRHGKLGAIMRWLSHRQVGGRPLTNISRYLNQIDTELMRFYHQRPGDLLIAIGWHMAACSIGLVQTVFFVYVLKGQAMLIAACGAWFLASWFDLLAFAIPMRIGISEGARVVAFKAVGLNAVMGLTYGVTLRIEQIFWALFGLAGYTLLLRSKRTAR